MQSVQPAGHFDGSTAIAQRLAQTIYPPCRKVVPMDPSIRLQIEEQLKDLPVEFKKGIDIPNHTLGEDFMFIQSNQRPQGFGTG